MALKSTIYKADLNVADMDRGYYADHTLTIARHPSETDERMMVRLLAYALYAREYLELAKGLSDVEEPDIWQKDLTGAIQLWMEIGQPDERRLAKASGRSTQVVVFAFNHATSIWWQGIESKVKRLKNLSVFQLAAEHSQALEKLAQRTMKLQVTIEDGKVWFSAGDEVVELELISLKKAEK